jgi:hypothetical protein
MKKLMIIAGLLFFCTNLTYAKSKKLSVPFYNQDDACWCGVAITEMWVEYAKKKKGERWKWYKDRQKNLAGLNPVGKYSTKNPKGTPCGLKRGLTPIELTNAINKRVGKGGGYLRSVSRPVSSKVSKSFHNQVVHSITKLKEPIAVAGNTRYKNGKKKLGTHWYLIVGVKYNNGTLNADSDGYYIYDAAHGSPHTKGLKTISKGKFVSHRNFLSILAFKENNKVHYLKK